MGAFNYPWRVTVFWPCCPTHPNASPQAQSQLCAATDTSTESLGKKEENSASPKKSGSYALWFPGSHICSREWVSKTGQACEKKTKQ